MLRKGTEFRAVNEDGLVSEWVVIHQSDSAQYLMALPRNDASFEQATDKAAEFALTPEHSIPSFFNYREVLAVRIPNEAEPWVEEWCATPSIDVRRKDKTITIFTGPVL